jgi:DNA (cytosine-5)-methyltransferase 1
MKILNLYAGIGGNRKLWHGHEITAVEIRLDLAAIYCAQFPQDEVITTDAHAYLLANYRRFDFIWTSPPCPSHSRARHWRSVENPEVMPLYPDLQLYEEIIFLQHYYKGLFVAENVLPFYEPLVPPSVKLGRHLFWSNFGIRPAQFDEPDVEQFGINALQAFHGFDLTGYQISGRRDTPLRNCVPAQIGEYILNCALGKVASFSNQLTIF